MKINRVIFWIFSLGISLLSCYLFQLSSIQLYGDADYMQSLKLPSDADTPAVAITGTVMLTYVSSVAHITLLTVFFLLASIKRKTITVIPGDFILSFQKRRPAKVIVQLLAYLISVFWVWDFIETTNVKFFGSLLLFTILAILVTWVYALWTINFAREAA